MLLFVVIGILIVGSLLATITLVACTHVQKTRLLPDLGEQTIKWEEKREEELEVQLA